MLLKFDMSTSATRPVNNGLLTDRYYIIFRTHDPKDDFDPKIQSFGGHAWVIWAHENPQTLQSEINGYGFWPDRKKIQNNVSEDVSNILIASTAIPAFLENFGAAGKAISMAQNAVGGVTGSVPGVLQSDLFGTPYTKSIKEVVIEVDKTSYFASRTVIDTYKDGKAQYNLVGRDCVSFFIDVGKSIGLDMPERDLLKIDSWLPSSYMDLFIRSLESPNKITVETGHLGSGFINTITAGEDGSYDYIFGASNENENLSKVNISGDIIEQKIRNNNVLSTTINYPNGDSWYKEDRNFVSGGKSFQAPVSDYILKNGNTIIAYNYSNKPNNQIVNLHSGTETFYGPINQDGYPNGIGTLVKRDPNGASVSQKTGLFVNGQLIQYKPVWVGIGVFTGEILQKDKVTIGTLKYASGNTFTGSFKNGLPNGNGTLVSADGLEAITGNWIDGKEDGELTITDSYQTIKGTFVNRTIVGHGHIWYKNGKAIDGNWENGKLVSGTTSIPGVGSYTGTFDKNGNPLAGKYYDKHGVYIDPKDGNGGSRNRENYSAGEHEQKKGEVLLGHDTGEKIQINGRDY